MDYIKVRDFMNIVYGILIVVILIKINVEKIYTEMNKKKIKDEK
ncbi:MAG: hypothetical protein Ta2D_11010 [Rickettsiales bacterium]|nr:MAG: hypothetical protein Ta2D_11010 [Rickettsiales bacterium]